MDGIVWQPVLAFVERLDGVEVFERPVGRVGLVATIFSLNIVLDNKEQRLCPISPA